MSSDALYVTLRVPDPSALTALSTLRGMGTLAPARLERGRLWWVSGDPETFAAGRGVWFNPNKERGVRWDATGGGFGPAPAGERWVLVRDRGGAPEGHALRSMREQGMAEPTALLSATVWRMEPAPGISADAVAGAAAEVRSASEGLLVNRHSQVYRVCPPPASLAELERVLSELSEEAS